MPEQASALHDVAHTLDTPYDTLRLARRLIRIRARNGRATPLRANAAQKLFEQHRTRENIVLKARQMGITTWIAARFFLKTITHPGTVTLQVAHTREAAEGIFAMVRRMWAHLPDDLREGPLRLTRSNVGQLVFAEIGSEFRVASAADENAGRGLSLQNLHCSEVARWPGDAAATLAGLRAALTPDGECTLESTPNGAHGAFYEEWQRAGTELYTRHFFPWWLEPAYTGPEVAPASMTEAEQALVQQHALTPAQIGYRRTLERNYRTLRAQEFAEDPETCFRATGACCFEIDTLDQLLREAPAPLTTARNGALHTWLPPQAGRHYLLAVDTCGGSAEGDFAAAQVIDLGTGMQCAELQERLRPADLARTVAALARDYNNATIAVERNNHGAAVLAYLETSEHYTNLYREKNGQGELGFLTTAASKPTLIAKLGHVLNDQPERLHSRRLFAECRTFITDEAGNHRAGNGSHDDLVMSMAIAVTVRERLLLLPRSRGLP